MELETAIAARRSVRKFKSVPVAQEIIEKMLEMARLAPSGGNRQQHVFGVVRDAAIKNQLAQAAGGQMWIAGAPVIIACCATLDSDPRNMPKDDFGILVNKLRWGDEFWNCLTSFPDWRRAATLLANAVPMIPTEHMALCAAQNNLSCCFVGWLDVDRASDILKLPPDIRCLYLLPVGYADEQPAPQQRKSVAEISFCDVYRADE